MKTETLDPVERPMEVTPEVHRYMVTLIDRRVKKVGTAREDFGVLQSLVTRLAEAQARTEKRMEELAQAQTRSESRVDRLDAAMEELAQAQARAEERFGRLEVIVARTEERLDRVEAAVEKLAEAQARFGRTFETKMGAMGARWGLDTEESFRKGMRAILEDVGFKVERYLAYDNVGKVFDHPAEIELDVVMRDGKLIVIEIKSSLGRADVAIFGRKVAFYEEREGRKADRRMIISPFVEERAEALALAMAMELYTRADDLAESG